MDSKVIVVTGENIAGRTIQSHLGIVTGSTVHSKFWQRYYCKSKECYWWGLVSYSKLLQGTRDQAFNRMIEDAEAKGADGIIMFRFQTSQITPGFSEVVAYGTAVSKSITLFLI